MEGVVNINELMQKLKQDGLLVGPESIFNLGMERAQLKEKQRAALDKKALTFKEIADAQLWGPVQTKAVKLFAKKYAKPGDMLKTNRGQQEIFKILTVAVLRIAKNYKGLQWD